jgi:hypothetical protein
MRKPSKTRTLAKAKKASKTKRSKAKKAAKGKPSKAKKAAKKPRAVRATSKGAALGVLGCCTLVGSGPDTQYEGITKQECERRAAAQGKNPIWSPGKCAQPG